MEKHLIKIQKKKTTENSNLSEDESEDHDENSRAAQKWADRIIVVNVDIFLEIPAQ